MRGLAIGRHTPHGSSGPTTTIQFALHDNPPPFSSRGVSLLPLQAQDALRKKGILEGLGMTHPTFVARVCGLAMVGQLVIGKACWANGGWVALSWMGGSLLPFTASKWGKVLGLSLREAWASHG